VLKIAPLQYLYSRSVGEALPLTLGGGVVLAETEKEAKAPEVAAGFHASIIKDLGTAWFSLHLEHEDGHEIDLRLWTALDSLWLVRPTWIQNRYLLSFERAPDGGIRLCECARLDEHRGLSTERIAQLSRDDIDRARSVHEAILRFDRSAAVWRALSLTSLARTQPHWEMRLLIHWLALDGMLGTDEEYGFKTTCGQLVRPTRRLCNRLAFLVPLDGNSGARFYQAHRLFDYRSQIAHGLRRLAIASPIEAVAEMEELVRVVLLRVIDAPEVQSQIDGVCREPYLDGLVTHWYHRRERPSPLGGSAAGVRKEE
jgi:hypothetical protein